jgi:hypothetical protein
MSFFRLKELPSLRIEFVRQPAEMTYVRIHEFLFYSNLILLCNMKKASKT